MGSNGQTRVVTPHSRLWWVILLAMFLATAANVVYFFILTEVFEKPLLFPNQFPPPELSPLGVPDVVLFSLIFSAGAGAVYAVVGNLSNRPVPIFIGISAIVLLLSFALPLSIPSPPVATSDKLCLASMHITGAFVVVGTLVLLGSRSEAS